MHSINKDFLTFPGVPALLVPDNFLFFPDLAIIASMLLCAVSFLTLPESTSVNFFSAPFTCFFSH
jgi:hypothetical protein